MGLRIGSLSNTSLNLRSLDISTQSFQKSMEQLSSGLRINRAADSPSDRAIISKMDTKIQSKSQALRNILDGVGYIQTAEGSLDEITNMVHRIRTLTIQAASDTLVKSDRQKIQEEIKQIKESIDLVSHGSTFNGVQTIIVEADRLAQLTPQAEGRADISFIIDVSASMGPFINTVKNGLSSFVNLLAGQGVSARISVTAMANKSLGNNPRGDEADWTDTTVDLTDDLTAITNEFGKYSLGSVTAYVDPYNSLLETGVSGRDTNVGTETGLDNIGRDSIVNSPNKRFNVKYYQVLVTDTLPEGQKGTVTGYATPQDPARESAVGAALAAAGSSVYVIGNAGNFSYYDGITSATGGSSFTSINNAAQMLTDLSGISMDIASNAQNTTKFIIDKSIVRFQVGSEEGEFMEIDRPHITAETLGFSGYNVDLSKTSDISSLVEVSDLALEKISILRTKFGSAQNRLESRVRNLQVNEENLQKSKSQIGDLDFAEGVVNMTKSEILRSNGMGNLSKQQDLISKIALNLLNKVPTFAVI